MPDLFSPSRIRKFDPMSVHVTYEKWPSLAREGFKVHADLGGIRPRKAFVLGMGGSAAGGDIIAGWLTNRPGIEMGVFKGQLPIGDLGDALAIACSASGETAETIQMMETAVARKAKVVSISSGGRLMEVSKKLGVPHLMMPKVVAPRYILPFIVFSSLSIINDAFGLDCEAEAGDAIVEMEKEGEEIGTSNPLSQNVSKLFAVKLLKWTPAVYGARVTRGVGIRFKNVLNENSKKHAHFDGIPDAFHNEIEAWEDPTRGFLPIFLRHSAESDWDKKRQDRMVDILTKYRKKPLEVRGRGETSLAQLMSMVYRLDMASYYTAIGLERDPFPTRLIDRLKKGN